MLTPGGWLTEARTVLVHTCDYVDDCCHNEVDQYSNNFVWKWVLYHSVQFFTSYMETQLVGEPNSTLVLTIVGMNLRSISTE